jgi:hypothetical protein
MAWVVGVGIALFIFFAFPKQSLALLALLAVIVGGFIAYYNAQSAALESQRQSIVAIASIDARQCTDPKYPIYVTIHNGNGRTLNSVSFDLKAYIPGHSQASAYSSQLSDQIITAGGTALFCWSAPYNAITPSSFRWEASVSYAVWAN